MTQQLRSLTVFIEDLPLVFSTHPKQLITSLPGYLKPSSGLHGYCMHMAHTQLSKYVRAHISACVHTQV